MTTTSLAPRTLSALFLLAALLPFSLYASAHAAPAPAVVLADNVGADGYTDRGYARLRWRRQQR